MIQLNIDLLKRICETPGVPGYEKKIRSLILDEIQSLVSYVWVDNIGNVFALKKGTRNPHEKKIMVAAHMDEIGFIVTHIDDQGYLRFQPLGGFDPKTLTAQRVIVHGVEDVMGVMGTKPIHVMTADERNKPAKMEEFFVDLGMPKDEVEKWVRIGDTITRERSLVEMGQCINCKSLDNRISVFVLMETLRRLKDVSIPYDFYAVFTVQEEVGLRGATVAAHSINPDFAIALDTTIAYDVPGARPYEKCTELGKGTAIKILDSSVICDYRMVQYLKQTAEKNSITWQHEILVAGGTDTASLQRQGKFGSIAGAISIPTRHIHQVIEMVHKSDVQLSIDLLCEALIDLDTFDWSHQR
ncbi:MAG: M42 family metallopeptidase [Cytophagaceae bacterium]|jgi:endoglucanase|nr:M42 family metallopeptidase [Cytophagaceae bacterium]